MSYNFDEENDLMTTAILDDEIEQDTQEDITDIIDDRVSLNHSTIMDDFEDDFDTEDEEDTVELNTPFINFANTNKAQKDTSEVRNPFFGRNDTLEKMRAKRQQQAKGAVVEQKVTASTLIEDEVIGSADTTEEIEVFEENANARVVKPLSQSPSRKKMWLGAGICCFALVLAIVVCNVFSIGAINRDLYQSESILTQQEQTIEDLNVLISTPGEIPEGMATVGEGNSINVAPTHKINPTTSDNIFNKIAKFISYLFGR